MHALMEFTMSKDYEKQDMGLFLKAEYVLLFHKSMSVT